MSFFVLAFFVFLSIGLLSFVRKPHVEEFNCWYYKGNKDDFRVEFYTTPEHLFEATINSPELKKIIEKEAILYESREGYYCSNTKVKVITRFKKIVGVKLLEFHNTKINKVVNFEPPFEIDINTLTGYKTILKPEFSIGD